MIAKRGARMETNTAAQRQRRVSRIPRALPAAEHRADTPATVPGAVNVPIDKVERDPDQPRRDWRHAEGYQRLDELTQSIKEFRVLQLIENLQRQQLSPLDEARAYQEMLEIDALTTGSLAARLHVSTQTVRDKLRRLRADRVVTGRLRRPRRRRRPYPRRSRPPRRCCGRA